MTQRTRSHDDGEIHRILHWAVLKCCPPRLRGHAEDLTQQAMLRVLTVRQKSEGDKLFNTTYLKRVAYSVVTDHLRKRSNAEEADDEMVHRTPAVERFRPDHEAASRQIGEAIRVCLSGLIESRRRAVTLYLLGYTVPDAARSLEIKPKKAENLVYRGLTDLRACLDSKGVRP